MTMMTKKQKIARKNNERIQKENEILNKVLGIFAVGAIAEIFALFCYREFIQNDHMMLMLPIIRWTGYIAAAVAIIGIIYAIVKRKTEAKQKSLINLIMWLAIVIAVSCFLMLTIYPQGTVMSCVMIPVFTLYGFVYYLYQREFFTGSIVLGLSILSLWFSNKSIGDSWSTISMAFGILCIIIMLIAALRTNMLAKNNGVAGKGENAHRVYSANADYRVAYATIAAAIVGTAIGVFVSSAAFCLIWVMAVILFIVAVYYTTKLM